MKKANLLLVCLNFEDIDKIAKLNLSNYNNIILASDDFKVYEKSRYITPINKFSFLQKPISFTKVTENVKEMIDKVNLYFNYVAKLGFYNDKDLFWTYHLEGGDNQILQDIVLTIDSISSIIDEHKITDAMIIGSKNTLQTKVIIKLSHTKGFKLLFYKNKNFIDKNKIKDFLRPNYYLYKSLFNRISSKKINIKKKSIILFQLCGSTPKNIQNVLFIQSSLSKNGFTPINIIWGNPKEANNINNKDYNAISLEYYLKFSDILISLYKWLLTICKSKKLKNLFNQKISLVYKDIDLNDIIFDKINLYLRTGGPENYRYRAASQRFAAEYKDHIVAIKYCAAKFLTQGTILSQVLEDNYLKFDYDLGLRILNQYNKFTSLKHHDFLSNNFIRFTPNEIEKKYMIEDMSISEKNIFIMGAGRFKSHFENLNYFTKENSKREIGIYKEYEIYILLDISPTLLGYYSSEELYFTLNTLTLFAKKNKNIALMIKPNYSFDLSIFSNFFDNNTDNIYLIKRISLPDHALNLADLFITKYSTMGMECMIYDTQVVSILFDKDKSFKVYGDAAKYIYKKEDLDSFLEKRLTSKDNFIQWKNSYTKKRSMFMKKYYPKEIDSEEIIVKTIKKYISFPKRY